MTFKYMQESKYFISNQYQHEAGLFLIGYKLVHTPIALFCLSHNYQRSLVKQDFLKRSLLITSDPLAFCGTIVMA